MATRAMNRGKIASGVNVGLLAALVFGGLWLLLAAILALGGRAARTLDRGEGPWIAGL